MYRKLLVLVLTILIIFYNVTGCTDETEQGIETNVLEKVDTIFTTYFESNQFNGHVLIGKGNKILYKKAYGMADNENQTPITHESIFDIGSITKQFTATGIMILQEKGLLNVNDTVDKYIPNLPHGDKITIHHLLTHTSGITNDPSEFDIKRFDPNNNSTSSNSVELNLLFEPGQSFSYSSPGYILLGYIIESVSGQELNDFFEEKIFKPLEMKNTKFKNPNSDAPNLAVGYVNQGAEKAQPSFYDTNYTVRGGGGLCSNVKDLFIWNNALYSDKVLTQESIDKIFTPNLDDYGYGYFIRTNTDKTKTYEHYGIGAGYRSYIMRNPSDKTFIIILSNYQDSVIERIVPILKKTM